jgi:hypothetical protein
VAEGQGVRIANFLCPGNYAISGGLDGCAVVEKIAKPDFKVALCSSLSAWCFNRSACSRCACVMYVMLLDTAQPTLQCQVLHGARFMSNLRGKGEKTCCRPTFAAMVLLDRPCECVGVQARMTVKLAVAGAFHTDFMQPAVERLRGALASTNITAPRIPVISNVDAQPHSDPDTIRDILARQVCMQ